MANKRRWKEEWSYSCHKLFIFGEFSARLGFFDVLGSLLAGLWVFKVKYSVWARLTNNLQKKRHRMSMVYFWKCSTDSWFIILPFSLLYVLEREKRSLYRQDLAFFYIPRPNLGRRPFSEPFEKKEKKGYKEREKERNLSGLPSFPTPFLLPQTSKTLAKNLRICTLKSKVQLAWENSK